MAFSKARRLGELVTTAGVLDQATVATASSGDNDTSPASTAFVTGAIADLSDSAPSTLNTLNELAAALGDDANFSTTVTNSIATKLPLAGGTLTGNLAHASDFTLDVGGDITLDAGGENIRFDLNGNEVGQIDLGSANFSFRTSQGGDFIFRGTPTGGSEIAMLTIDTSASGDATFSNDVYLANGKFLRWGDGSVRIYGDSTDGTELMTFVTGGSEAMRIASNGKIFINETNTSAYGGLGHLVVKQTADNIGIGVIDVDETNTFKFINNGDEAKIEHNGAVPIRFESGNTQHLEIHNSGAIKSGSGGMVLQTKEEYNATAASVSGSATTVVIGLDITVKQGSKVAVWFNSGQIQNQTLSANPNGVIQWVQGGTVTNISDHNYNHTWWDGTDNIERMNLIAQGVSGALSAGTYNIRFLGGTYNGTTTWNFQSQGSHLIVQEIAAN